MRIGQLMASLRRLLLNAVDLREITLVDLILERFEANKLMDTISRAVSLQRLNIVNLSQNHCPIPQIAMLSHLEVHKLI